MALPVILRILSYLKDNDGPKDPSNIATALDESPSYILQALRKLETLAVVSAGDGGYSFIPGHNSDRLLTQMAQVYAKVDAKPARELLIRGYICQIPQHSLFHMDTFLGAMEREGLDLQEVTDFLLEEMSRKYIKSIGVVYQAATEPLVLPICITPFHFDRLQRKGAVLSREYEGLVQGPNENGSYEEAYILAEYPAEVSGPATEFLKRERRDLTSSLRRMGVVGWHGWWWRLKRKERPNMTPAADMTTRLSGDPG